MHRMRSYPESHVKRIVERRFLHCRWRECQDRPVPSRTAETCDCCRGREESVRVVRYIDEAWITVAAAYDRRYNALTSASAGCNGRRPVACSTCCRQEMPGATTMASGLFSTAGKSRRLPIAIEIS